jgi:hypothetical protein
MIARFQKNFFFASEEDIVIHWIVKVLIFPHLWQGRMYHLLGIHHTLVWNRVLKNKQEWFLQILLRGRQCWRMWCIHGVFHPFEVRNLGEIVSVMAMITTKSTREVISEVVVVIPPLGFIVIISLGVMVTFIVVSTNRLVLLGVIPPSSWVIIVSVFFLSFWHYWTGGPNFPYSVVQNFEIVEWERVEIFYLQDVVVLVEGKLALEYQEMENTYFFVATICRVHTKA